MNGIIKTISTQIKPLLSKFDTAFKYLDYALFIGC